MGVKLEGDSDFTDALQLRTSKCRELCLVSCNRFIYPFRIVIGQALYKTCDALYIV